MTITKSLSSPGGSTRTKNCISAGLNNVRVSPCMRVPTNDSDITSSIKSNNNNTIASEIGTNSSS